MNLIFFAPTSARARRLWLATINPTECDVCDVLQIFFGGEGVLADKDTDEPLYHPGASKVEQYGYWSKRQKIRDARERLIARGEDVASDDDEQDREAALADAAEEEFPPTPLPTREMTQVLSQFSGGCNVPIAPPTRNEMRRELYEAEAFRYERENRVTEDVAAVQERAGVNVRRTLGADFDAADDPGELSESEDEAEEEADLSDEEEGEEEEEDDEEEEEDDAEIE